MPSHKNSLATILYFLCFSVCIVFSGTFSSCSKSLSSNSPGTDTTGTGGDTTITAKDSVSLIGVISGNDMATTACEYYPGSKKISKLYFKDHAAGGDTSYFVYNSTGQLTYMLRTNIDLFGGADELHIYRHDESGRINKVFFILNNLPATIDTSVVDDPVLHEINYDSVTYDSQNRITALYFYNTHYTDAFQGYDTLIYDAANDSLLSKVVAIANNSGTLTPYDSIKFTGYTNIPNPYYSNFQYYPFISNTYRITFLPYGSMQEFMLWNKYLCSTVKFTGDDGTKYLFYTLNNEQMPVRYFIGLFSWDANEYYENYTSCTYTKLPK